MGLVVGGLFVGVFVKGGCLFVGGGGKKLFCLFGGSLLFWSFGFWFLFLKVFIKEVLLRLVFILGWFFFKLGNNLVLLLSLLFWNVFIGDGIIGGMVGGVVGCMGVIGGCMKVVCGCGWYVSGCWVIEGL